MTPEDALFMELKAKVNLKIYLMNPGDEFFAPINNWPQRPQVTQLTNNIEFMQIEIKKATRISKKECNDDKEYEYGGKYS